MISVEMEAVALSGGVPSIGFRVGRIGGVGGVGRIGRVGRIGGVGGVGWIGGVGRVQLDSPSRGV